MTNTTIRLSARDSVIARDRRVCRYCYGPGTTIDHVIPWSVCRSSAQSNLVVACLDCNEEAGDRVFGSFEDKQDWILASRGLPPAVRGKPTSFTAPSGVPLGDRFPWLAKLAEDLA